MGEKPKILLAGESWVSTGTHVKGFNDFFTSFYEEGRKALSEALSSEFVVEHLPSHLASTQFQERVEDLAQYAVILFSDIGSDTLLLHPDVFVRGEPRPNRLKLVKEYVLGGGGFGMIGGYMSFSGMGGRAKYHRTPIEEILPVDVLPYDDRVETPEGFSPTVVDGQHPILSRAGGTWPILLGYNRISAKQDAQVLLEHDNDPILAVRSIGKGRSMAFATDCAPHWGSPKFLAWDHYADFWLSAMRWLANV